MSDQNDPHPETQPVRPSSGAPETPDAPPPDVSTPEPVPPAAPAAAAATAAPARRTLRERVAGTGERLHTTRALLAAALAALIVGGLGGAVVHAATDGHDRVRFDRGGFGRDGFGPGGPGRGGFGPGGFDRGERPEPRELPQAPTESPGSSS